jgi:hypothetical protein
MVAPLVAPLREPESCGNHRIIRDVARGLVDRGHDVTVYAAAGSRVDGVRLVEIAVAPAARRAFPTLGPIPEGAAAALADAFGRVFRQIRRLGCDVISQHAFDAPAIDGAAPWPSVHTLHAPPGDARVISALGRAPGTVAAVSVAAATRWREVLGRHVAVLRHGVADAAPPVQRPWPIALVAGRISREKGTATAIRVARTVGLSPVIAGEIHDPLYYGRDVRPQVRDAQVLGIVARDELWRWMTRASVLVMPIEWEQPFGLVAAEAQLAGCPVAGYRRGALAELVRDGIGGYLAPPGDEAALVAGVRRTLALDRGAIQRAARPRFTMRACLDGYERQLADAVHAAR